MKFIGKNLAQSLICTAGLLVFGCGVEADQETKNNQVSDAELVDDASLNIEAVEENLTDANEIMADSQDTSSENGFALADREKTRSRSCTVGTDGTAEVEISRELTRTVYLRNRDVTLYLGGSDSTKRTWSKADGQVSCDATSKYAAIDWKSDLTGLKVNVNFARSLKTGSYKGNVAASAIANATVLRERSGNAAGTRTVNWTAQTTSADTIVRAKTVTSNVTRTRVMTGPKGERELAMNVKTDEAKPLKIETVRDGETFVALSKTIVSGTLVAERSKASTEKEEKATRLSTEFNNLKFDRTAGKCDAISGSVTSTLEQKNTNGTYTVKRVIKVEVKGSGEYVATDITDSAAPKILADFTFPGCTMEDSASSN